MLLHFACARERFIKLLPVSVHVYLPDRWHVVGTVVILCVSE
jgi:hypothetical protein